MQDKFGKDGKFQVITSHLANYNKKAVHGIIKKTKIKIPVYQGLILSKAKPIEGVPYVVLFDSKGKVIEKDWKIENLEEKIKKLLE